MANPGRTLDVHKVATLARLTLDDAEAQRFEPQLRRVLDHIAEMDGLDTSSVEPTSHVVDLAAPLREDVPVVGLSRVEVMAQAPRVIDGGFVVPKFVEEG
jgi:aspartyl-tRNA(Asn)/glutamyl-tRNA(Gln) amidotransferase subunit C